MAKRNMKPEIRKAQREQAIKYVFFSLSGFYCYKKVLFIKKKRFGKTIESVVKHILCYF